MEKDDFQKEEENLKQIIKKYNEIMEYYDLRIEAIPKIYKNNPIMIENFIEMYSQKLRLMEKSIKKPILQG